MVKNKCQQNMTQCSMSENIEEKKNDNSDDYFKLIYAKYMQHGNLGMYCTPQVEIL